MTIALMAMERRNVMKNVDEIIKLFGKNTGAALIAFLIMGIAQLVVGASIGGNVNENLVSANQNLEGIYEKLQSMDVRLSVLDTKMTEFNRRLDNVESRVYEKVK